MELGGGADILDRSQGLEHLIKVPRRTMKHQAHHEVRVTNVGQSEAVKLVSWQIKSHGHDIRVQG